MIPGKRTSAAVAALLLLSAPALAQTGTSDFDGSGKVDFDDFFLFAAAFGGREARFDLNDSGGVDLDDFFLFASDFGKTLTPSIPQQTLEWTQIPSTTPVPPGRFDHTLIFDPTRRRLVVFGGRSAGSLGDTWVFDLGSRSWREARTSPSPPARHGHTALYDAPRRRVIIFGGQSNAGFFNDAWAFDPERETWEELAASGDRPSPRYGLSAVFDIPRNRMVISHGFTFQGRFDDTWSFDLTGNAWANLTPVSGPRPLKRCLHEAVYDGANDRMLLFGGCSSGAGPCPQGDLWAFDLKAMDAWTELKPSGGAPGARSNPALAYDSANRRALLFGGLEASGDTNDLWAFDVALQRWARLSPQGPAPSPRHSHDTVIDAANGRLFLFGGTGATGIGNDLWELRF